MARDSSALRSKQVRAVSIQRQRDKETMVARRAPQQTRSREIRSTFEPSRLSRSAVAQAYEQVVPVVRRIIATPASSDCAVSQDVTSSWAPRSSSTG